MGDIDVGISGRPVAAWNGSELFVDTGDPVAWNPVSNTWRSIERPSELPLMDSPPLAALAVDGDTFVLSRIAGSSGSGAGVVVYGYGPDLDCCRQFDAPPVDFTAADAAWSGETIFVVGAASPSAPEPGGKAAFAAMDPESGKWEVLADPPFETPTELVVTWSRDELFAWVNARSFARWTPEEGWRELPDVPISSPACTGSLEPVGRDIVAVRCGEAAIWSSDANRWLTVVTPESRTGWGAAECLPADRSPAEVVRIWCSSPTGNPTFWALDTTAYETVRFGPSLETGSPWELLPNPVADAPRDTDMVWTGEELLTLCGTDAISACSVWGWGYDPDDGVVHRVAPDAEGTAGQNLIWIGDELLVVRGLTTAYDPFSLEWRTTQPGPILGQSMKATWTGTEVIFFGSERSASASGVTYEPGADTWNNMAPAPIEPVVNPVVAWSGSVMHVSGGWTFDDDGISASQRGAAYDPATNKWRLLPPLPGAGLPNLPGDRQLSGHTGGWVDGRFIIVGAGTSADEPSIAGFSYDPTTDSWSEISQPRDLVWPSEGFAGSMSAVAHGDELAVLFPGAPEGVIGFYRPATNSWRYVGGAPGTSDAPQLVSGQWDDGRLFIAYRTRSGTVLLDDPEP
jgi:hypothetical protein